MSELVMDLLVHPVILGYENIWKVHAAAKLAKFKWHM